jgi:hypothetical protein
MKKMTIQELLEKSKNCPKIKSKFYREYMDKLEDVSFQRLLTTLVDQETQDIEYFAEKLAKLSLKIDFGDKLEELFDFEIMDDNILSSSIPSKIDFLKKAIKLEEISIANCKKLEKLSNTGSGSLIFKALVAEDYRHQTILREHLELEELF